MDLVDEVLTLFRVVLLKVAERKPKVESHVRHSFPFWLLKEENGFISNVLDVLLDVLVENFVVLVEEVESLLMDVFVLRLEALKNLLHNEISLIAVAEETSIN